MSKDQLQLKDFEALKGGAAADVDVDALKAKDVQLTGSHNLLLEMINDTK